MAPTSLAETEEVRPPVESPAPTSPFLTVVEAAAHSRYHPQTLYTALREYVQTNGRSGLRGSQTASRSGRWRIRPADLEAWMAGEKPAKRRPA
jgi:hypothetical protein